MKYKPSKFNEVWNEIFQDEEFLKLSSNAKWLYFVLNRLEHRFTNPSKYESKWFYRKNEDLAKDCNFSIDKLKRAKKELLDTKWVKPGYMHWIDKDTNKKSEEHVCTYELL